MTINYKPLEKNLEEGMVNLGNQIKTIPHLVIGNNKPPPAKNDGFIGPKINSQLVADDIFNPKEQKIINTIKKWGLILTIAAVITYAGWRIIF